MHAIALHACYIRVYYTIILRAGLCFRISMYRIAYTASRTIEIPFADAIRANGSYIYKARYIHL